MISLGYKDNYLSVEEGVIEFNLESFFFSFQSHVVPSAHLLVSGEGVGADTRRTENALTLTGDGVNSLHRMALPWLLCRKQMHYLLLLYRLCCIYRGRYIIVVNLIWLYHA